MVGFVSCRLALMHSDGIAVSVSRAFGFWEGQIGERAGQPCDLDEQIATAIPPVPVLCSDEYAREQDADATSG